MKKIDKQTRLEILAYQNYVKTGNSDPLYNWGIAEAQYDKQQKRNARRRELSAKRRNQKKNPVSAAIDDVLAGKNTADTTTLRRHVTRR